MKPRIVSCIDDIAAEDWNSLTGTDTAFTCHEYLLALEHSGSADPSTGWHPQHLVWEDKGKLLGAMPLYQKDHSYGEYVFDWSWAEAYQQTGANYYPKLLCAIPFTPVPGPRLFVDAGIDKTGILQRSFAYLGELVEAKALSSLHLLFPDTAAELQNHSPPLLERQDIQFIWKNHNYEQFEDFLATLKSSKRKQVRRERRKIQEQGIEIEMLRGEAIDSSSLAFFCQCYQATYLKRSGHGGYLREGFFKLIRDTMPNRLVLAVARQDGEPVASALFFIDQNQLCGRYWGCMKELDCLHFELCYYQGIDFCIANNLATFNPGTQGEHKLVRGFEPQRTHSFHLIPHNQFHDAVRRSLLRENVYIDAYEESARSHLPFRND